MAFYLAFYPIYLALISYDKEGKYIWLFYLAFLSYDKEVNIFSFLSFDSCSTKEIYLAFLFYDTHSFFI